jgi:ubiquinone biosynthesis protein Coq4
MEDLIRSKQDWESSLLESFWEMVNAPDGNFGVLARLSQSSNDPASLDLMIEFLCRDRQGKRAFEEQICLGQIDLEKLSQLPQETLGYAYSQHMIKNNLKPLLAGEIANEHQFLLAHITETHDIWHVITDSDTSIYGEIKLEAFSFAQVYASRFWLALLAKNLLKSAVFNIETGIDYVDALTEGWLMAKQAKPLFGIQWNTLWEKSLTDIRASLNIVI